MKVECNIVDSNEIRDLFQKFDEHRERYVIVNWIELTKVPVSRRNKQVEVDCIKVDGKTTLKWNEKTTDGTRYIYRSEKIFTLLNNWMISHIRDNKIKQIGL
jgi:hypothetical protein